MTPMIMHFVSQTHHLLPRIIWLHGYRTFALRDDLESSQEWCDFTGNGTIIHSNHSKHRLSYTGSAALPELYSDIRLWHTPCPTLLERTPLQVLWQHWRRKILRSLFPAHNHFSLLPSTHHDGNRLEYQGFRARRRFLTHIQLSWASHLLLVILQSVFRKAIRRALFLCPLDFFVTVESRTTISHVFYRVLYRHRLLSQLYVSHMQESSKMASLHVPMPYP